MGDLQGKTTHVPFGSITEGRIKTNYIFGQGWGIREELTGSGQGRRGCMDNTVHIFAPFKDKMRGDAVFPLS